LLPFTVTKPVTDQEISIALDTRDTKFAVGRELTKGNSFSGGSKIGIAQSVPLLNLTSAEQGWIGDRGRRFEVAQFAR